MRTSEITKMPLPCQLAMSLHPPQDLLWVDCFQRPDPDTVLFGPEPITDQLVKYITLIAFPAFTALIVQETHRPVTDQITHGALISQSNLCIVSQRQETTVRGKDK